MGTTRQPRPCLLAIKGTDFNTRALRFKFWLPLTGRAFPLIDPQFAAPHTERTGSLPEPRLCAAEAEGRRPRVGSGGSTVAGVTAWKTDPRGKVLWPMVTLGSRGTWDGLSSVRPCKDPNNNDI